LLVLVKIIFFDPEDGGDVPPKRRLQLNRLHGVSSQKMILFITAAVKTSKLTNLKIIPLALEFSLVMDEQTSVFSETAILLIRLIGSIGYPSK
jgi:hypothetical protein